MKLATLCYVFDGENVLMLNRNKREDDMHKGKYNGLGGKFIEGETPEECALREIKEESGLNVSELKLRGFITFPAFDDIEDWYVFVFTAKKESGELIEPNEGELEWIPWDKVTELPLWEGDKIFLDWLHQDKFFSAKFIYQNNNFKDYSVLFY